VAVTYPELLDRLEPAIPAFRLTLPVEDLAIVSIAISLKRLADVFERVGSTEGLFGLVHEVDQMLDASHARMSS